LRESTSLEICYDAIPIIAMISDAARMRAKIPDASRGRRSGQASADTSDAIPLLATEGQTVSDSALPVLLDSPSLLIRARRAEK
jgi:hypothetical protein